LNTARNWWLAARPKTLPAAIVPVATGAACAAHFAELAVAPTVAALAGSLLLQVGSNFANDVYDFEKGADTEQRLGPTRAVAAGLISPQHMKRAMLAVFALAALVGCYLASVAGPLVVVVGVAAIISAIGYTGGPFPLGYNGLGELFVFIFFGLVAVTMTVFVNLGAAPPLAWVCAVPVGCLAAAILVVNNVRDVETDRVAGKRTLAVRFGRRFGERQYAGLVMSSYLAPPLAFALRLAPASIVLPLLTLPFGIHLTRRLQTLTGSDLNPVLADTAKLLLAYGILLCAGLSLPAFQE
jgi:1,4-dihydroxy-2-naphthoate polyprenyltransferase